MAAVTGHVKTQQRGCAAAVPWDSPCSLMGKPAKVSKGKILCEDTCACGRGSLCMVHTDHLVCYDWCLSDPKPNPDSTIRFTAICTKLRSRSFALLLPVVGFAVEHFSSSGSPAMTSMTVVRGEDAAAWALTTQTDYYTLWTCL